MHMCINKCVHVYMRDLCVALPKRKVKQKIILCFLKSFKHLTEVHLTQSYVGSLKLGKRDIFPYVQQVDF